MTRGDAIHDVTTYMTHLRCDDRRARHLQSSRPCCCRARVQDPRVGCLSVKTFQVVPGCAHTCPSNPDECPLMRHLMPLSRSTCEAFCFLEISSHLNMCGRLDAFELRGGIPEVPLEFQCGMPRDLRRRTAHAWCTQMSISRTLQVPNLSTSIRRKVRDLKTRDFRMICVWD